MTSSQVNYLARCGNFVEKGLSYKGTLRTLKVILGYDYLWINVRVKGGAYGVMNGAGRFGDSYFVSYRDPNLRETNEVYEGIVPYLEQFEADERDMTKFVIGTISDLDAPLLPPYKGIRADAARFTGVTDVMIQKERDEIPQLPWRISGRWRRLSGQCSVSRAFVRLEMQRKSRQIGSV